MEGLPPLSPSLFASLATPEDTRYTNPNPSLDQCAVDLCYSPSSLNLRALAYGGPSNAKSRGAHVCECV